MEILPGIVHDAGPKLKFYIFLSIWEFRILYGMLTDYFIGFWLPCTLDLIHRNMTPPLFK